ncbi:tetratricopeptide repeat protein [Porphyromonadaceae bacterium W3.11]|nr:tetratricopeptide repeat protein [Porphyromonadaceae bacterium W3.11]
MTSEELRDILEQPELLTSDQLPDLMALSRQYPYSAPLHILILLCLHRIGDLRFSSELHRRVLYIQDLSHLFILLDSNGKAQNKVTTSKLHVEEEEESGFDLINTFLEDHPDDTSEIDYILSLDTHTTDEPLREPEEKEDEVLSSSEIISSFLDKGEEAEVIKPIEEQTETAGPKDTSLAEDELLTETLARIYIRQGKYDRALKILRQINLEYPKKSGYFAQQISFLEKLTQNNGN